MEIIFCCEILSVSHSLILLVMKNSSNVHIYGIFLGYMSKKKKKFNTISGLSLADLGQPLRNPFVCVYVRHL